MGTLARWRGVYNHSDSYPTCLGQAIYDHLIEQMTREQKTLAEIGESILAFDDWRNYRNGGICPYCGKIASQAHAYISGRNLRNRHPGFYPIPNARITGTTRWAESRTSHLLI